MSTIYITFCLFPSIMMGVSPSPRAGREFAVFFQAACRHPFLHGRPSPGSSWGWGTGHFSPFRFFCCCEQHCNKHLWASCFFFFFFNSFTYLLEYCSLPSLRSSGGSLMSPRRGCSGDGPGVGGRGSSGRPGLSLPSCLLASTCPAVFASPDRASFRLSRLHQRWPINHPTAPRPLPAAPSEIPWFILTGEELHHLHEAAGPGRGCGGAGWP